MITHKWTDGLMEGSTQDVTEDQQSQPLAFLKKGRPNVKENCYVQEKEHSPKSLKPASLSLMQLMK